MKLGRPLKFVLVAITFLILNSVEARAAANVIVINGDLPGVGFNDPFPSSPVGGNNGTTVGAQKLIAAQRAADLWGATLNSAVTIRVFASFQPLPCNSTTVLFGFTSTGEVYRDFQGAPFPGTWYGKALADKLAGTDLNPQIVDVQTTFNSNLGEANCLSAGLYLGLDDQHGASPDFITIVLHELSHGLGFQSFTNGQTGAFLNGFPSVFDRFMLDNSSGKNWLSMTDTERVASAVNNGRVVWNGPNAVADAQVALTTTEVPVLRIDSPAAIAGSYDVGIATFGPPITSTGVSGTLVQAFDPSDGPGPSTTDGCSLYTNSAEVAGKIAVVDRGGCTFNQKAHIAELAGATSVVIVDIAPGAPPQPMAGGTSVGITAVRVTMIDGNLIKSHLGNRVVGALITDPAAMSGADSFHRPRFFTPEPFQSGSSVSHWDAGANPNLLMEPVINSDLTHALTAPRDLTYSLMKDIGWEATNLPSSASVTGGDGQTAGVNRPFAAPIRVKLSAPKAGVVFTFTAPNGAGAGGTFATSGNFANATAVANSRVAVATTDANGVATAPLFTANGQAGAYQIFATAPGSATVAINATNVVPTAANVSVGGRVATQDGVGLRNALVTLAGPDGVTLTARTNSFGRFLFTGIAVDRTYVLRVNAKSYVFSPQVFGLVDEIGDLELIAEP